MAGEIKTKENVSKKVIGVKSDNPAPVLPPSLPGQKDRNDSSNGRTPINSFDVINEWEQIHDKKIKGKLREVSEYVAKENLSKKLPTKKEIKVYVGITNEYCKKILTKSRRIGLLAIHQKRTGHQYKYYVTNIQNHVILKDESTEESEDEEVDIERDLLLPLVLLDDLMERENLSFHHINLKSKLRDISDYHRIDWTIQSDSNKGKIFELKLSQYRRCEFIVYPKGTVNMIIKCSNDPLYLTNSDDVADFFSNCGEIVSILKAETSNSEPLIDDVANWRVTQIDAAFDLPLSGPQYHDKSKLSNKKKGFLSYSNFGTFRLKYLGHFYQMYSKNVLHKGKILRIERRFSFLDIQPTVDMILERIVKQKDLENS
jgi:hypothetical protein